MTSDSQGELFSGASNAARDLNVESGSGEKNRVVPLHQDSLSEDAFQRESGSLELDQGRSPRSLYQIFEVHSYLHIAIWGASFGVCNLILYHLFSYLFASELSSHLIDARSTVYAIILSLLGIGSSVFLILSATKEEHHLTLAYQSLFVSIIVAASFITISSLITIYSLPFQAVSAAENLIWITFALSIWVLLRSTLLSVVDRFIGFPEFQRGIASSTPYSSASTALSVEPGEVVRHSMLIEKGVALVDERQVGGKSEVVLRQLGDTIPAGSRIVRGKLLAIPVQKTADRSIHWFVQQLYRVLGETEDRQKDWSSYAHGGLLVIALGLLAVQCLQMLTFEQHVPLISYLQSNVGAIEISQWVISFLAVGFLFEALPFSRSIIPLFLTRLFFKGVIFSGADVFRKLSNVGSVGFRAPQIADFKKMVDESVGKRVQKLEILDPRVDKESLCSVVFGLLRNTPDENKKAVRRFCFENAKQVDLFPIDDDGVTESGITVGTIQGATFLIGSEVALLEQGVQLELSDTIRKHSLSFAGEHLFVSLGSEVVARFAIESAESSELPQVVEALRKLQMQPRLYGDTSEQEELDAVGKASGFELADIRVMKGSQDARYGRSLHMSDPPKHLPQEACDLEVHFQSKFEPSDSSVNLTWFRPAIWNVAHEGVLLTTPSISLVSEVLRDSRAALQYTIALFVLPIVGAVFIALQYLDITNVAATVVGCSVVSLAMLVMLLSIASRR